MSRRKRVELEQRVAVAALAWEEGRRVGRGELPLQHINQNARAWELEEAIKALREYGPTETLDGPGSYVIGSPETSAESATLATPLLTSVRRQILDTLRMRSDASRGINVVGCTDDELEWLLRRKHTTVSSARNWLVNAGWLRDSGYRRKTASGRNAVCWCLTDAALERMMSPQWMTDHAKERE